MIKCAYKNILETSTVSLAAGTADPDFPLYRLYDRGIGRLFKSTAAETIEIKIDQGGAATPAVDRLLIPAKHNLDSMTLDIKHSDDDITYTPAVPQWTATGSLIDKSWTSITHRYWKFIITSPASIPEIAELFLTQTYEWNQLSPRPAGSFEPVFNVENVLTAGGQDRFLVHGDPKRQRSYQILKAAITPKNNMAALYDAWAGSMPFWLYDHGNNWIFGKLKSPLNLQEVNYLTHSFEFDFLEVLP